ncbi:MAG: hypothetical protein DMD86_08340 [Candidatus Rokuibacteriota bacterium]|nr:MAG: hypothetical protein DMD86_08340 [Candidatus Rokubacteria bacterium]
MSVPRGSLASKTALVTGAARGIGFAIAARLASEGARVAVLDLDAAAAASAVEKIGGGTLALIADVTKGAEVAAAVRRLLEAWGRLDVRVNNAGITGPSLPIWELSEEDWRRVIDADLTSVFLCCRAAVPVMLEQGSGRIINIASIAGKRISIHGAAHYTAAKAGVIGLTRHLAYELGPFGIRVNALCPGETMTPLMERIGDPAVLEATRRLVPLGRSGMPEDQANAVLMLLSERARYVTGVALDVDGGMLLGWMDYETYEGRRRQETRVDRTG